VLELLGFLRRRKAPPFFEKAECIVKVETDALPGEIHRDAADEQPAAKQTTA
jgi:hypothetical protein